MEWEYYSMCVYSLNSRTSVLYQFGGILFEKKVRKLLWQTGMFCGNDMSSIFCVVCVFAGMRILNIAIPNIPSSIHCDLTCIWHTLKSSRTYLDFWKKWKLFRTLTKKELILSRVNKVNCFYKLGTKQVSDSGFIFDRT